MTAALQQQEPSYSDPVAHACGTPEEQRSAAASHLAHDARNWLTVLQVYCDLLRSSGAVAGHGRTWIDELSNAVERGQGLVTSLLDSAQNSAPPESSPQKRRPLGRRCWTWRPSFNPENRCSGSWRGARSVWKAKLRLTPRPPRCRRWNSIASC